MKTSFLFAILSTFLFMTLTSSGDVTQDESTSDLLAADEVDAIPDVEIYRGLKGRKGGKRGKGSKGGYYNGDDDDDDDNGYYGGKGGKGGYYD
mmetsp:Transcript_9935/g.24784  ORF Transcript_9935/g.24784 Transcript_9935/m.24784 type:complete len:93 (+) Transcript_9935:54-332(+)